MEPDWSYAKLRRWAVLIPIRLTRGVNKQSLGINPAASRRCECSPAFSKPMALIGRFPIQAPTGQHVIARGRATASPLEIHCPSVQALKGRKKPGMDQSVAPLGLAGAGVWCSQGSACGCTLGYCLSPLRGWETGLLTFSCCAPTASRQLTTASYQSHTLTSEETVDG
jgi:hypothetical protein